MALERTFSLGEVALAQDGATHSPEERLPDFSDSDPH
jgi:hypothetical protein